MKKTTKFFLRLKQSFVLIITIIACSYAQNQAFSSSYKSPENKKNNDVPAQQINFPDSLIKYTNAVVNEHITKMTIHSESKMTEEVRKVITIMNSGGDSHGYFTNSYDNASKIRKFKGAVYNKENERVIKYGKKDLKDFSLTAFSSSISDMHIVVLRPEYPTYPYTVVVEYIKVYKDLFDIRDWYAMDNKAEAVMKSELIVENRSGIPLRYKAYNTDQVPEYSHKEEDIENLSLSITNLRAIPEEPYAQSIHEMTPHIKLALSEFSYDGYDGRLTSWQELGQWIYKLGKGRDNLPPSVCEEIQKRVEDLSDEQERIEAVYSYMQERSRYVSIQLGLGGWQPFETRFVHEKGYGDCKALSFYTMNLLQCIGVEAKYTLIHAGPKPTRIDESFPANQFNHVILSIPQQKDTIWLECTSMEQPFNYLGTFTNNRKALTIDQEGSKLVKTPAIPARKNIRETIGTFSLNPAGDIKGQITTTFNGLRYDIAQKAMKKRNKEHIKNFYRSLDFAGGDIQHFAFETTDTTGPLPSASRRVKLTVDGYGKKSGSRIFLTPNMLNRSKGNLAATKNRVSDIIVNVPKYDVDSINYKIPENTSYEHLPDSAVFYASPFGTYYQNIYTNDSTITFVRKYMLFAGRYPASKYDDFVEFKNNVSKADQRMIVLITE